MIRSPAAALFLLPGVMLAQNAAKISGIVTDALTHRPIPNVHVGGSAGSSFVGALTAFDGSYTLENIPTGKFRISVNLDGYRLIDDDTHRDTRFTIVPGDALTRNFELHPLGRIYGKITDRDTGNPLDGHPVSAVRKQYFPGYTHFAGQSAAPKGGEFNIGNLEAGDYIVEVGSPNEPSIVLSEDAAARRTPAGKFYGAHWYPDVPRRDMAAIVHLGEGENRRLDLAIESRETHSLLGTIETPRDLGHNPLTLTLQPSGDDGPPRVTRLSGAGPFRIDNLTAGSYAMVISSGDAAGEYEFEIRDHDVDDFKAALLRSGGVRGEVRMLEEDAVLPAKTDFMLVTTSGWFAQLRDAGIFAGGQAPFVSVAVESGRFRQDRIRPGEYWPELLNVPPGYAITQILFTGATSRYSTINVSSLDTPITFVLTSHPGSVAGVVRDSDQNAVPGATVILLPDPAPEKIGPAAIRTEQSSSEGAFAFRDLAPGNYRAVVLIASEVANQGDINYLRERAARAEPIEVRAGQQATVSLKH